MATTSLHVPAWGWAAVAAALVVLFGADALASSRRDRPVSLAEAAGWTLATVVLAVAFSALLALTSGGTPAGQFFAGWLTEYSLSLDNLLVFVILISRSHVPGRLHGRVLLAGIGLAVVLRGAVIALGAAALHRFGWLEYLFGAFLLYTAAQVARRLGVAVVPAGPGTGRGPPTAAARQADRVTGETAGAAAGPGVAAQGEPPVARPPGAELPGAELPGAETPGAEVPGAETPGAEFPAAEPSGAETPGAETPGAEFPAAEPSGAAGRIAARLTRRGSAGVLALVIALGVTDVMFALDSIPAVFGLTRDPFLVFSANVFALLGLRHLYFLVAGLLARLVYLQAGLSVILAFIGLKLIGEALRGSGVTRLGPVPVPQVGAWLSLVIIALVLAVAALASTMITRRRERRARAVCGGQH